jgi:hypothetical protein
MLYPVMPIQPLRTPESSYVGVTRYTARGASGRQHNGSRCQLVRARKNPPYFPAIEQADLQPRGSVTTSDCRAQWQLTGNEANGAVLAGCDRFVTRQAPSTGDVVPEHTHTG